MEVKPIAQIHIPKEGTYLLIADEKSSQQVSSESELLGQFVRALGPEILTLGGLVKFFRERKAWSQRDLQRECGLPHSHISKIENGKTDPEDETIRKLTEALGSDFEAALILGDRLRR